MGIFEDTNPRALKELLGQINDGNMVLPDFQRDFVWEPSATRELIVSIANNYPAGSLLRVRDTQRAFAPREFEGAPQIDGNSHIFLVLDGQQRMTSLYQAFFGVGDHRYFLDLNKLIETGDFDEALFYERASTNRAMRLSKEAAQHDEMILPLGVLKAGSGGFLAWVNSLSQKMTSKMLEMSKSEAGAHEKISAIFQENTELHNHLSSIGDSWISVIDDYRFPVVTLSDETKADALCTIFETLNRTGVKLSVFELLTARFWPQNINLRELWDKALAENSILDDFKVDPYYLLQAISLASRPSPSCKRSDILNLGAEDIRAWWDKVVRAMALALVILRDDCKVMAAKWIPYQTMLVPMAAIIARQHGANGLETGIHREKLKKWFWCSVFGQTYESSANSQSAKDVTDLDHWLSGGNEPESIKNIKFDPHILRKTTPRQRGIYRGVICLILATDRETRDFHTQSVITSQLVSQEGIDDHHIFPNDYLEKELGIGSATLRNCVLNRTLIDRTTNQIISNNAPSIYLSKLREAEDFPLASILHSHCLPSDEASPLFDDNFDIFLKWRQEKIWEKIQGVTGISAASQLELTIEPD